MQYNTVKQSEPFSVKNTQFESTFALNKTNPTSFAARFHREPSMSSQVNQLFKIPSFEDIPVKKATVRCINSPRRRVQSGRVEKDSKRSQQSKMSSIPRPTFSTSRKFLHSSRSSQIGAKKEIIKKMVLSAECSLKENSEMKESTPVKRLAGLTPNKMPRTPRTPRPPGTYLMLPEFRKKVSKVEDIRSPIQDFVRKEIFAYTAKPSLFLKTKSTVSPVKAHEETSWSLIVKPAIEEKLEVKSPSEKSRRFTEILSYLKAYNRRVRMLHEKIKMLDSSLESKLKDLPEYRVYNEFCVYQNEKEELNKQLHILEVDLGKFVSTHIKVGDELQTYMKKKQEIFEKQLNLHKVFEQAVSAILEQCESGNQEKIILQRKTKVETPKVRRSLRLSKIRKGITEDRSPMTRRLKKLDSKSRTIQKSRKV